MEKAEHKNQKKQKKVEVAENLTAMEMGSSSQLPHVEDLTETDALALVTGITANTRATEVTFVSYQHIAGGICNNCNQGCCHEYPTTINYVSPKSWKFFKVDLAARRECRSQYN